MQTEEEFYYPENVDFDSQFFNGNVFNQKYLLVELLGCGAFCGVFLVFNLQTDSFLCLKVYEEDNKPYYEKETTAFARLSEIDEFYK
jgi:hypothetical protein